MKKLLRIAGLILIAFLIFASGNVSGVLMTADAVSDVGAGSQAVTNFDSITLSGALNAEQMTSTDDMTVADTLDVNGDIDLDGDGFDVDITAGGSIDTDGATNLSASTGDLTLEAETGSVIVKGDEAAADAILIDADQAVTSGLDINVGSVSGLTIDGGLADIGGGSYDTADGDNDLGVAGDVEIDGELELDGALDADSTANISGAVELQSTLDVQGGDITLENDETISNSTDGRVVVNGDLGFKTVVIDKAAAYTVTVAESGALFTNDGASGAITFTLPSLAGGLRYCFTANDNQTVAVDPAASEQILSETNAGGDQITSGAQFDVICLVGVTDGWLPVETTGTWADAD